MFLSGLYLQHYNGFGLLVFAHRGLTWIGVTTPEDLPTPYRILHKLYRLAIAIAGTFMFLTCTGDLVLVRDDLTLIGEDLCIIVGVGLIMFKYIVFVINYQEIRRLINDVLSISIPRNEARHDRRAHLHVQDWHVLLDVAVFLFFQVLALSFFACTVFVAPREGELPLRAWLPFDERGFPYLHEIVYTCQGVGVLFALNSIIVMDNVVGICWHQIGVQLIVLANEFSELSGREHDTDSELNRRLEILVMRHQCVIALSERLNKITSPMLCSQVFASNFLICLSAFEVTLTTTDKHLLLKFVLYMSSVMGQLLYWCIHGEFVQTNSINMAKMVYSNTFRSFDKRFMNNLRIILCRAQKPITIRATNIFSLCLQSYLSILRKSYSYFAVLRSLAENEE